MTEGFLPKAPESAVHSRGISTNLGGYCKPFAIPRVHYCQIDNIQPVRVWRVGPAILCTPVPRDGISLLFFLKQTTNRVNQGLYGPWDLHRDVVFGVGQRRQS